MGEQTLPDPHLVLDSRALALAWEPADPLAAAALAPRDLRVADGAPVFLNQYTVPAGCSSYAGSAEEPGPFSVAHAGVQLEGLDAPNGLRARWWTHYLTDAPGFRSYVAALGAPAGSAVTTVELDGAALRAITSVDGRAVIAVTTKVALDTSERRGGQARYVVARGGGYAAGAYPYVADFAELVPERTEIAIDPQHPLHALRPARRPRLTFAYFAPRMTFSFPGGDVELAMCDTAQNERAMR